MKRRWPPRRLPFHAEDWLWKYTPSGFRYRREDGMRLIPRRPCGDDNHCWRCQKWWWTCDSCNGLAPDIAMYEIEGLPEGSWGAVGRMETWYH